MRLIDADALSRLTQIYEFNGKRMEMEIVDAKFIDNAPTIDVAPVRHGRWIESTTDLICSACETAFNDEIAWMCRDLTYGYPMYCPYCGAKMDEEKNDGNQ